MKKHVFVFGIALGLAVCGWAVANRDVNTGDVNGLQGVERVLVPLPMHEGKKVEIYAATPEGAGPWPAVILFHGYQAGTHLGGEQFAKQGELARLARSGYVAVAFSQPGYGASDGPPDYSGPTTQRAALAVIDHVRALKSVVPGQVALVGYGEGATAAALTGTRDVDLGAIILMSGLYDLRDSTDPSVRFPKETARVIRQEAGVNALALARRSVVTNATSIRAPTLILTSKTDDDLLTAQAAHFAKMLNAAGTVAERGTYSEADRYALPRAVLSFLGVHMKPASPVVVD